MRHRVRPLRAGLALAGGLAAAAAGTATNRVEGAWWVQALWFGTAVVAVLAGGRLSLMSRGHSPPADEGSATAVSGGQVSAPDGSAPGSASIFEIRDITSVNDAPNGQTVVGMKGLNVGARADFRGAVIHLGEGSLSNALSVGTVPGDTAGPGERGVLLPPTGRLPVRVRGRSGLLAQLGKLAVQPDGQVHLLAGLGGVGKSTVALRVAEVAAERGGSVWWVSAANAPLLTSSLLGLAEVLGARQSEVEAAFAGQRDPSDVLWRQLENRSGWVLVIDNADDVTVLASGAKAVRDGNGWLRPTRMGLVVVTSRDSDARHWGRHVRIHQVSWLPDDDGARILLDRAPQAGPKAEAVALSARLGGLPLALHHAGSHLSSPFAQERTFVDYRRALETRLPALMTAGSDDREIVTSTWEMSLEQLANKGVPQARKLLAVLSQFAGAVPIPAELLDYEILGQTCASRSADDVGPGLEALQWVGLIETRSLRQAQVSVTVHPVVRDVNRQRAVSNGETNVLLHAAVSLLRRCADTDRAGDPEDPERWSVWSAIAPHAFHISQVVAAMADPSAALVEQIGHVADKAARYLRARGLYETAEAEYRVVLATQRHVLGEDHVETLKTRRLLAFVLHDRGRYEAAEAEYRVLFDLGRQTLSEDHPEVMASRNGIAHMLRHRACYKAAAVEYRAVLDARRRVLGQDHRQTLITRQEFASVLQHLGFHEAAENEYRTTLAAQERTCGEEHPDTLNTHYHMASFLHGRGRYDEAEVEYKALLRVERRIYGDDHPSTLATRFQLAHMLRHHGRHEAADAEHQAVLAARRRVLGDDHPELAHLQEDVDCL
jgi:tetratricopeptide (TPR) repeat protein